MRFYGVADYDFDGSDRLRGIFYSSVEDAVLAPDFDSGSIDVFDGYPPRRVESYDVHTVELYEVEEFMSDRPLWTTNSKSENYLFFTVTDQWGSGEDMLMIVVCQ